MAGDITTLRGQHGGLRLARPPAAINIGDVVRRTEPDMALVTCFGGDQRCVIQDDCVLQHALDDALTGVPRRCWIATRWPIWSRRGRPLAGTAAACSPAGIV